MYLFVCFSNKNHYYLFEEIIVICIFFKFSHMKVHTCACMYISPNLHFIEQGLYTILFMIIKSDKRTWGWRLTLFKVPLLLLSRFSHVRHWVTPYTAAHQALPSLGFPRQEHWSGLPFPSPMHGSEKWKWGQSCLTLRDPLDCSPPGSSIHGIFQARILEWGAIAFSDPGSIPGLGRSAGERIGYPLQYSWFSWWLSW